MFVMPSHSDAFAKAFVESMAAGCAIICGNRQPQKFLFSRFGCAVDPNSPAELAEAIAELASNRDLTARFATASREAFSKSYDPELVGEAYFNTFLDVINGRALSQRPVADLAAARPS
jgi:glycosyltransferase involved in cell wall biosynthesis